VLFSSGIWYGKLISVEIIFKEKFIAQKCYWDIYMQWNSASTTTHWTALNWSC